MKKILVILSVCCLFILGACEFPTKTTVEGYVKEGQDNQLKHHEGMLDAFKAAHPEAADDFNQLGQIFNEYMIRSDARINEISAENETLADGLAKVPGFNVVLAMLGLTSVGSTIVSRKISPSSAAIAKLKEEIVSLTLALAKKAPKDETIPG